VFLAGERFVDRTVAVAFAAGAQAIANSHSQYFISTYRLFISFHIMLFFSSTRSADTDTIKWAEAILGVPVIDHFWQTETGSPILSSVRFADTCEAR